MRTTLIVGLYTLFTRTEAMQSYHRAEFLKILEKNIPSSYRTHFGKRLVSYTEDSSSPPSSSEPVTLHFKDGSTAKCDVLVGADGIRSAVRRTMFSDLAAKSQDEVQAVTYRRCVDAAWSGVVTYRALVKTEAFKAEYPDHTSISSPVCVRSLWFILVYDTWKPSILTLSEFCP